MKILWYADFEGSKQDLDRIARIMNEVTKEEGGSVEGPFLPQNADLMFIASVPEFEWLNRTGRKFLQRVEEEGLDIVPLRYEVAVTPEEFWGQRC